MNIFSVEFLFLLRQSDLTRYDQVLFVVFGTMLALSVAFGLLRRFGAEGNLVRQRLFARCFRGLLAFGIVGTLWSGLRYLVVPVLGIRFVALLILAAFVVWLGFVIWYLIRKYFTETKAWDEEQLKEKYLRASR